MARDGRIVPARILIFDNACNSESELLSVLNSPEHLKCRYQ